MASFSYSRHRTLWFYLSKEVEWLFLDFHYVTLAVAWKDTSMEGPKHKSDYHAGAEGHTHTLHASPTEVYAVSWAGAFPPHRGATAWMSTPQTSLFLKSWPLLPVFHALLLFSFLPQCLCNTAFASLPEGELVKNIDAFALNNYIANCSFWVSTRT